MGHIRILSSSSGLHAITSPQSFKPLKCLQYRHWSQRQPTCPKNRPFPMSRSTAPLPSLKTPPPTGDPLHVHARVAEHYSLKNFHRLPPCSSCLVDFTLVILRRSLWNRVPRSCPVDLNLSRQSCPRTHMKCTSKSLRLLTNLSSSNKLDRMRNIHTV